MSVCVGRGVGLGGGSDHTLKNGPSWAFVRCDVHVQTVLPLAINGSIAFSLDAGHNVQPIYGNKKLSHQWKSGTKADTR